MRVRALSLSPSLIQGTVWLFVHVPKGMYGASSPVVNVQEGGSGSPLEPEVSPPEPPKAAGWVNDPLSRTDSSMHNNASQDPRLAMPDRSTTMSSVEDPQTAGSRIVLVKLEPSLWDAPLVMGCQIPPEQAAQLRPKDPQPMAGRGRVLVVMLLLLLNVLVQLMTAMLIQSNLTVNPYERENDPEVQDLLDAMETRRELEVRVRSRAAGGVAIARDHSSCVVQKLGAGREIERLDGLGGWMEKETKTSAQFAKLL